MKALIGTIVAVVVIFFAVPMIAGGTVNACKALEEHAVSNTASSIAGGSTNNPVYNTVNSIGQAGATGQVASTMMAVSHPNAPSPVSCTYYYWKSLF